MRIGTKVLNNETKEVGYVIRDTFGCCIPSETLVVYEGTNTGLGTDSILLTPVIPNPPHKPDPKKCGAGRGEECCIFLTVSGNEFNCERFSDLRDNLIFRKMVSERNPKEPYPVCMIF